MHDVALFGDKRMTVRDVSNILGVDPEAIKKHVRELYPGLMRNGVATYLDEAQVVEIKKRMMPTTKVAGATTDLEMAEKTLDVIRWYTSKVEELRGALDVAEKKIATDAPKVEAHDALMRTDTTMSTTDAAKHFGLPPRRVVFPWLRGNGYLTARDVPTQKALGEGLMVLVETPTADGTTRRQAKVEARQLDNWYKDGRDGGIYGKMYVYYNALDDNE